MKLTISQEKMVECIKRGGYAALSDEAQTDNSTLSRIVKSIKITATDDELIFESATSLIASKYVEPVSDDVVVKESGTIMVSAKDLFDWVNKQNNCIVGIRLKTLDSPEVINLIPGEEESSNKASIKKIGTVEITSRDSNKKGSKWSLDCLDHSIIPPIGEVDDLKPLFIAPLEQILDGIKYTVPFAMPKDTDHLFDAISFQNQNGTMYMMSTDCTRCSTYKINNADNINIKESVSIEEYEKNGLGDDCWKWNLLIPFKFMSDVTKMFSNESVVSFYRDEDKNKVFICQPGFTVKMSTAEKDSFARFPFIDMLISKDFSDFCALNKSQLLHRLNTVSIVNKNSILFVFTEKDLTLEAISESGLSPCKANMDVEDLSESMKVVFNVKHFMDALKNYDGDSIKILMSEKKNAIKIILPEKTNLEYYSMVIENTKYKTD